MAKPDTDDGWIKMAHELDAALAFADFTKLQRVALHFVFAQTFQGHTRRRDATLSPSAVAAEATGSQSNRGNVRNAIAGLVADGVLTQKDANRYAFVKDYERWKRSGAARFTATELAFIKAAPSRAAAFRAAAASAPRKADDVIHPDNTGVIQSDNAVIHPDNTGVIQSDNKTLSNQITESCSPPTPPPLSGGRIEEGRRGEAPAPRPIQSAPESDPEIKRVAVIVDRLDPHQNGGWAMKVGQFASMYPPAWILAACEAAAAAGKGDWRYVHGILRRYQSQGGPNTSSPSPRRNSDGPPPGMKFSEVGQRPEKPYEPAVIDLKVPEPGSKVGSF